MLTVDLAKSGKCIECLAQRDRIEEAQRGEDRIKKLRKKAQAAGKCD